MREGKKEKGGWSLPAFKSGYTAAFDKHTAPKLKESCTQASLVWCKTAPRLPSLCSRARPYLDIFDSQRRRGEKKREKEKKRKTPAFYPTQGRSARLGSTLMPSPSVLL